jgi:hypothetical protein
MSRHSFAMCHSWIASMSDMSGSTAIYWVTGEGERVCESLKMTKIIFTNAPLGQKVTSTMWSFKLASWG